MSRLPLLLLAALSLVACKDDGAVEDSEVAGDDSAADDSAADDSAIEDTGPTDADGDGSPASEDCDDADASAFPGAEEVCDGVDNDCDGDVDGGAADAGSWFPDGDGDGFGWGEPLAACEAPSGHVADNSDCDDRDAAVNPGATELCDGVDNDCDALVDDEDDPVEGQLSFLPDLDGDGYGDDSSEPVLACVAPSGATLLGGDCDDGDASTYSGAVELCDAIDNDCDGDVDQGLGGDGEACPADDCAAVLAEDSAAASGVYWLDLGAGAERQHCEMSEESGGWVLLAVSSDDGTDTWTWDARRLLDTDTTLVGAVDDLTFDYKSEAWHLLGFTDLLFVHQPSGVTAAYAGVGDGSTDLGSFIGALGEELCLDPDTDGYALTGGTLSSYGSPLCSTDLYFNPADQDGSNGCGSGSAYQHAHGPTWSLRNNNGCPFDDPGRSSMGGDAYTTALEWDGRGFGGYLGLNTGAEDAGENRLEVYAR